MGHWQKKNLPSSDLLLLWPGEVRRKREDDLGRIGPALFDGTNISDMSIKEISSTSYWSDCKLGK